MCILRDWVQLNSDKEQTHTTVFISCRSVPRSYHVAITWTDPVGTPSSCCHCQQHTETCTDHWMQYMQQHSVCPTKLAKYSNYQTYRAIPTCYQHISNQSRLGWHVSSILVSIILHRPLILNWKAYSYLAHYSACSGLTMLYCFNKALQRRHFVKCPRNGCDGVT